MASRVPVEVKLQVVTGALALSVTQWAEKLKVSRETIYAWRRRYAADGVAGLEDRSRAPRSPAGKTPAAIETLIIEQRHVLHAAGRDVGADTIWGELRDRGVAVPSVSTVWRILARHGEIVPEPRKRPKGSVRRFQREFPNDCWQIDATHYRLVNGTVVEIINVVDDRSRLCVASLAVPSCTSVAAVRAFDFGADRYGPPRQVLSDNGKAFASDPGAQPVLFEAHLIALGVEPIHSRPYHPQTCGKVERFHQTQQRWLAAHRPARTVRTLQALCDEFVEIYNANRPHRALDRRTPIAVYNELPKAGPQSFITPPAPPSIARRHVNDNGNLALDNRHIVNVGRSYGRRQVVVVRNADRFTIADPDTGEILRELELDRTRRYQPRP